MHAAALSGIWTCEPLLPKPNLISDHSDCRCSLSHICASSSRSSGRSDRAPSSEDGEYLTDLDDLADLNYSGEDQENDAPQSDRRRKPRKRCVSPFPSHNQCSVCHAASFPSLRFLLFP
jgi:hypothetical protein